MRALLLAILVASFLSAGLPADILAVDATNVEVPDEVAQQEKLINDLIEQLGHPKSVLRDQAEKELRQIGPAALDALTGALEHTDIEIVMRAKYLLGTISVDWVLPGDSQPVRALMKGYPEKQEEQRREVIEQLAAIGDDNAVEALSRIVRFEESYRLSKEAALAIIDMPWPASETAAQQRTDVIRNSLGRNTRTSSKWLRTFLATQEKPAETVEAWTKYIEDEHDILRESPRLTDRRILRDLLMYYIALLEQIEQTDEAQEAMKRLVALETGEQESVLKLVEWLMEKEAWGVIDEVYARFSETFDQNPLLLYTLAQAKLEQGMTEEANEIADRALKFNPGVAPEHLIMAYNLQDRGLFQWAELEYEQAIEIDADNGEVAVRAGFLLSEMLHDIQREKEAAETLNEVVEGMKDPDVMRILQRIGRDPGSVVSRMHYFWACHWRDNNDPEKAWEALDKAVAADPSDADVLIAMHRAPDLSDEQKKRVSQLISQAAATFEHQIKLQPNIETAYNQYAWLISNTEGDYDKALKYSLRSLELRPNEGGYLDTLARCYYALGRLDDAVKTQRRAVNQEPFSMAIRRQLELFEEEAAKAEDDADKSKTE